LIAKHGKALEYDLMTRTGHTLADVPEAVPWEALSAFVARLDMDSATVQDIRPELAGWTTRAKTNAILADIADVLAMINANLVALGQRKRAKIPEPYPRPGSKADRKKHIGSDPLPPDKLREWIEERRKRGK